MKPTQDELLGHEADGIREFNNALPRWWLYGFYFTIAFALVYFTNYHLLSKPLFGQSNLVAEYRQEMDEAARQAKNRPVGGMVAVAALTDHESLEEGKEIFEGPDNTCYACHRPDLGGLVGPNLTDEYWLHGCTATDLVRSIRTGFPQKGMLPFGTGKALSDEQVLQVVSYVLSKKGSHPSNPKTIDPERDKVCGTQP